MCRVIAEAIAGDVEQQGQEKGKDGLSGHLKMAQLEGLWTTRRQAKTLKELREGWCDWVSEGAIANCDL